MSTVNAFIEVTNERNLSVLVPVDDIKKVRTNRSLAIVEFRSGGELRTRTSVSAIKTLLDAKETAFLDALS